MTNDLLFVSFISGLFSKARRLSAANALANEQAHVLVYQVKRLASAAAGTALYASLWAANLL
jgi:hypothetical protein